MRFAARHGGPDPALEHPDGRRSPGRAVPAAVALIVREKHRPVRHPAGHAAAPDRPSGAQTCSAGPPPRPGLRSPPRAGPATTDVALNRCLQLAVDDVAWLCRPRGSRLPPCRRTASIRRSRCTRGKLSRSWPPARRIRPHDAHRRGRAGVPPPGPGGTHRDAQPARDRPLVDAVLELHAGLLLGKGSDELLARGRDDGGVDSGPVRPTWFDGRLPQLPGPPGSRLRPSARPVAVDRSAATAHARRADPERRPGRDPGRGGPAGHDGAGRPVGVRALATAADPRVGEVPTPTASGRDTRRRSRTGEGLQTALTHACSSPCCGPPCWRRRPARRSTACWAASARRPPRRPRRLDRPRRSCRARRRRAAPPRRGVGPRRAADTPLDHRGPVRRAPRLAARGGESVPDRGNELVSPASPPMS